MTMSERSTVVGIFTEEQYADLAADDLRRVGFSDEEMTIAKHKDVEGTLAGLKRLFKGQEATPVATANDFMRMGIPEREAQYYESELNAGHTTLLVRVAGQQQENQVLEILRKRGGLTSGRPNSATRTETDQPHVAPDIYDPVANRDAGESIMTPEDPR